LVDRNPIRRPRLGSKIDSFCSFSKIATPGMRLGLASGKKEWIDALIKIKQAADLHSSLPMA